MAEIKAMESHHSVGSSSKMPWIVLIVVIVIIAAVAFLFRGMGGSGGSMMSLGTDKNASGLQAVFLTNGQVYFGKINQSGDWITLDDVFYLQVGPQQGAGTPQQQQPQISLVELGGELHGPTKLMHINKTQVLFWEDMKKDAKVVTAINDYKKNQKK
ncbi:MAG TPA: hypothetical protein VEA59_04450 [Patescibacteria group bacterium]|nr:hypothetical protein [Patescibacteria group bacterium]